jgi:predicted ATPase
VVHERTGRAIEELYRGALDEHYAELAHHYGRTDNTPKAVEYLRLAGEQAVGRSAYAEAIGQLSRGVELVETLPETRERARQELLLQLALGPALIATRGYGTPEAEQAYARARDLCEQVGEATQLFRPLLGLFTIQQARADHDRAGELAEELLRLARGTRDPAQLSNAHLAIGVTCHWHGELSQAREHVEAAIERYDPQDYRAYEYSYTAGDPGVVALVYLSWTLWMLGYPDQALRKSREALPLARELSHPFSQSYALFGAGYVHQRRGESQAALEEAEALIALSSEHGFLQLVGIGTFQRAVALVERGQLQEGIAGMRAVLEALRAAGTWVGSPDLLTNLAEAHRKAGQAEEGLALVVAALEFVAKTGERVGETEVHRIKGELLLAREPSDHAGAVASFREALDVARRQSAKSFELRAATSLARLWQRQGREREARELLAPVYDWFTEGFDTRDLKDAKALLEELA